MTSTLLSSSFLRNVRYSAKILEAMNHPLRRRILTTIEDYGSLNTEALSGVLAIRSNLIANHLDVLRKAEIVNYNLEGKQFFYSLNYERIQKISNVIHGLAES